MKKRTQTQCHGSVVGKWKIMCNHNDNAQMGLNEQNEKKNGTKHWQNMRIGRCHRSLSQQIFIAPSAFIFHFCTRTRLMATKCNSKITMILGLSPSSNLTHYLASTSFDSHHDEHTTYYTRTSYISPDEPNQNHMKISSLFRRRWTDTHFIWEPLIMTLFVCLLGLPYAIRENMIRNVKPFYRYHTHPHPHPHRPYARGSRFCLRCACMFVEGCVDGIIAKG